MPDPTPPRPRTFSEWWAMHTRQFDDGDPDNQWPGTEELVEAAWDARGKALEPAVKALHEVWENLGFMRCNCIEAIASSGESCLRCQSREIAGKALDATRGAT